ncbi:PqqD family protein, HPr-rel-A system [Nitrosomonas cryotolerans]|uniref:PqqD family protein, HPr-rel-A system n=1 Tax=Nitrosomonas cryotolerans ATCC 49181 TaxID=1131553 RepID=A0A1N6GKA9_9PROT|nr:HPr-rel-A system PqqD family peptide chaperone [Nitrosomonas cryotolerans]SFP56017.1 PqqD family protein, HPr-rel-A system [Nitrosomonas cryotolerans]SIO07949.1 PqqD family protein, HPr-rel-A system [Nitrosomonas cryotolerans ATCC 49181]
MSSEVIWRSTNFSSLRIEEWDDEFTVYQPDSGKTHFINQMGMHVISTLNQTPASIDEICSDLAKRFQLSPDPDFVLSIRKVLYRFEALGLIEKTG